MTLTFVAAYLRRAITREQLQQAGVRLLGESGKRLAVKLVAVAAFGPVYLCYLLARTALSVTQAAGVS